MKTAENKKAPYGDPSRGKPQLPEHRREGLVFRMIAAGDIQELRLWRNREQVRSQFVYNRPVNEKEQESWYETYQKKDDDIVWIAGEEKTGRKVGSVALYAIDRSRKTAEIGRLILAEGMEGRGFGRMLLREALRIGFDAFELEEIEVKIFYDNLPSMHINLSLGFIPCGVEEIGGRYLIQMKIRASYMKE